LGCELLVQAPGNRAPHLIRGDIIIQAATQRYPENLLLLENFHFGNVCQDCRIASAIRTAHLTSPHLTSPHLTSPHLTSPHLYLSSGLRGGKADQLVSTRRNALELTNTFLPAAFLEVFGDPIANPFGLPVVELGDCLSFVTSGSRGWADYYAPMGARFIRSLDVRMNTISASRSPLTERPGGRTRSCSGDLEKHGWEARPRGSKRR
jgi:hypothetical protein